MTVSQSNPPQLHPHGEPPAMRIVRVGREQLPTAVARLVAMPGVADDGAARRFLEYADATRVELRHFYAGLNQQQEVVAAVLGVPSPGKTAMVFASRPTGQEDIAAIAKVLAHAVGELDAQSVNLAQALLELDENMEREVFEHAGFHELAILSYVQRALPTRRSAPTCEFPPGVTVRPYSPRLRSELAAVLEASYEQTLDCPGLVGLRKTEDILTGHLQSGSHDASLWTLLYEGEQSIGALLLNPAQHQQQIELAYMGLALKARGRGLGRQLLRYGLSLLVGRQERHVLLAVDEANEPAMKLYRGEGFKPIMRRRAMIRAISSRPR
jgi:ribosomal protein S18 acetylase RimI-like enzyme